MNVLKRKIIIIRKIIMIKMITIIMIIIKIKMVRKRKVLMKTVLEYLFSGRYLSNLTAIKDTIHSLRLRNKKRENLKMKNHHHLYVLKNQEEMMMKMMMKDFPDLVL
jgi:hypothetical protein